MVKPVNPLGDPNAPVQRQVAAERASLDTVYFQRKKYLVPAEWNLIGAVAGERDRRMLLAVASPGFRTIKPFLTPASGDGFPWRLRMQGSWALLGREPAYVGNPLDRPEDPSAATYVGIDFGPPPGSGTRIDFAIAEMWYAEVAPKVATDAVSKLLYDGGSPDLGVDLTLNTEADYSYYVIREPGVTSQGTGTDAEQETTRRWQIRWRIRVIEGVNPTTYPNYFGDPVVTGRGDAGVGQSAYPFVALDDALEGSGVAGDGSVAAATAFKSIAGYTWAIPICAAYRVAGDALLQPGDPNVVGYTRSYIKDLRRPIVPRPEVIQGPPGPPGPPGEPAAPGQDPGTTVGAEVRATGVTTLVLGEGNFGIGHVSGGNGQVNTWDIPTHGDDIGPWSINDGGAGLVIPYRGGFPLFPRDLAKPAGWRWYGELLGVVWRGASADPGVATHNYGIRILSPALQVVATVTFNLGISGGRGGVQSLGGLPGARFLIPDPGDLASYGAWNGLWRTQLFSTFAGGGQAQFTTGGIYLHIFPVKIS